MPTVNFYIKQGSRLPILQVALLDGEKDAVDLTTASTVKFSMVANDSTTPKVSLQTATVTDATNGEVEYAWGASDTDTEGDYYGEFLVTWGDGKQERFPSQMDIPFIIRIAKKIA